MSDGRAHARDAWVYENRDIGNALPISYLPMTNCMAQLWTSSSSDRFLVSSELRADQDSANSDGCVVTTVPEIG